MYYIIFTLSFFNNLKFKLLIQLYTIIFLLFEPFFFKSYSCDTIFIYILNNLLNLDFNLLLLLFLVIIKYIKLNKIFISFLLLFFLQNSIISVSNYQLNINLLNGIFLIHPILLYIFYSNIIYILILIYNNNNSSDFNFFIQIKNILKNNLNIIFLAVVLGSWWALQELSWGFWWNWDLIEIINLIYFIYIVLLIHNNSVFFIKYIRRYMYILNIYIIIFVIVVRYNLIQSIHNFIAISGINQYIIYIFFFFIIFFYFIRKSGGKYYIINRLSYNFIIVNLYFSIVLLSIFFTKNFNILTNYIDLFTTLVSLIVINILGYVWVINVHRDSVRKTIFIFIFSNFFIKRNIIYIYKMIRINFKIHIIVFFFIFIIFFKNFFIEVYGYIGFMYNYLYNTYNNNNNIIAILDTIYKWGNYLNKFFFNVNNSLFFEYTFIKEYKNQITNSFLFNFTWSESFNHSSYLYMYIYITNFYYFLFIYIYILWENNSIFIRKIYD